MIKSPIITINLPLLARAPPMSRVYLQQQGWFAPGTSSADSHELSRSSHVRHRTGTPPYEQTVTSSNTPAAHSRTATPVHYEQTVASSPLALTADGSGSLCWVADAPVDANKRSRALPSLTTTDRSGSPHCTISEPHSSLCHSCPACPPSHTPARMSECSQTRC